MLHTINKSPFDTHYLDNCLRFISEKDVLLLFEAGVFAAANGTKKSGLIENLLKTNKVYALLPDIKARGIDNLIEGVETAGYEKFVDLVEEHTVQAWL